MAVSELDEMMESLNRQQREHQKNLEHWKSVEREHQERIGEDTKELEKITNKQSLLLKKVFLLHPLVPISCEIILSKQETLQNMNTLP